MLSEKLHSNLVKEWEGSVVSYCLTFPVVAGLHGTPYQTEIIQGKIIIRGFFVLDVSKILSTYEFRNFATSDILMMGV